MDAIVYKKKSEINNEFYDDLGSGWYTDRNHPIALLRAENFARNPWIAEKIWAKFNKTTHILDVGCGAGFLTNFLALQGHDVTGIDLSESSLEIAKKHDRTSNVNYIQSSADRLPFFSKSFDVVCAMDLLEHVDHPLLVIQEACRVLNPGGLLFFHTFNRNLLSYFMVIKAVEWLVPNTPKNMHIHRLFIKPCEIKAMCNQQGLHLMELKGLIPKIDPKVLLNFAFKKRPGELRFRFSKSLMMGYMGVAVKL